MDHHLPGVPDDGEFSWSDSHSMGSDDAQSLMLADSPRQWTVRAAQPHDLPAATMLPASAIDQMSRTGQLFPVSNHTKLHPCVVDDAGFGDASSALPPALVRHSGSVSSSDSWGMDDMEPGDTQTADSAWPGTEYHWEQESDDVLTIPKVEPLDDDEVQLNDVKEAPSALVTVDGAFDGPGKMKRPRGRPRKHPLPLLVAAKTTKGRSKTGCLTCRKRKKKCDEAKPRCMNCEKNSVFCEGYPEKQIWKSGKQRAEEERLKAQSLPIITMQPIFYGLETTEDRIFWRHYNKHVSGVFTVEGDHKNAFTDMIIPIAVKHQGLMHSILSLSSKHIDYHTPYGMNILRDNPLTTREALQYRAEYHHESAFQKLRENVARHVEKSSPEYRNNLLGRYGQMLCLTLESMVEGNTVPDHRHHLTAYQVMIQESPPEDPAFFAFIDEFFQYHIAADELLRVDESPKPKHDPHNWTNTMPSHSPRLLGVNDGLFDLMSQVNSIRSTIRSRLDNHIEPAVDYTSLYQADGIYAAIQSWNPSFPSRDSRALVGLLYKQMIWIYLFRTVHPPSPCPSSASLPSQSGPLLEIPAAIVNTPPQSVASSCASSPTLPAGASNSTYAGFGLPGPASSQPSLKNNLVPATPRYLGVNDNCSQTIGQRIDHDPRIKVAVEESLSILESFKPSDPSQTLLLMPCLIIGSACFARAQQDRVRAAVRAVRGYTGLRNADCVSQLLEEVWRLMDAGDWGAVWDWQSVAKGLGLEFLI